MNLKPTDHTRRVALFQSTLGSLAVWEVRADDKPLLDDWVRVSEPLEITLTPLSPEHIKNGQLSALYAMRVAVKAKFAQDLANLDGRIQSLKALPAPRP